MKEFNVDEYINRCEENQRIMNEKDQTAKANGELLGRYIQEPYADGYAIYEIIRVNKKSVRIRVVKGIGDDWQLPYWGSETSIPLEYAQRSLHQRDRLAEIFSERKK